jgi:hypothetical protein
LNWGKLSLKSDSIMISCLSFNLCWKVNIILSTAGI